MVSFSRRRALFSLIVALVVLVGVLVMARIIGQRAARVLDPLTVSEIDAPAATSAVCAALIAAMPTELAGSPRRVLTDPVDGVLAWGDPAVTVRCGIADPVELTCSSALQAVTVDGKTVQWLPVPGADATTYFAVDRSVRVAATIPDGAPPAVIQELTATVATAPAQQVCTNGHLNPTLG